MKTSIFIIVVLIVAAIVFLHACKKEDKETHREISIEKITGYVQKGPYVNGTSVLISELNDSLGQTGKVFTTQIVDNKGTFEISNIQLSSQYVEFKADGFYFDEIKGETSVAPLTLYALSDITDKTSINVNILTHLEKERVKYLVKHGLPFAQVKDSAQKEILAIFGIQKSDMANSENLNISVNSEDNAILLAVSVILQGYRSVGDLTELLANISTDIREDGVLNSETTRALIFNAVQVFDLDSIRNALENRYRELGVTAVIPDFEAYIPGKIEILYSTTNPDYCSGTLGGIDITVTGGCTPYTFLWSNGETSEDLNNLDLGHYEVTVTDANFNYRQKWCVVRNSSVCDSDGNKYKVVLLGGQFETRKVWMAENLKVTRYRNGDSIPEVKDSAVWNHLTTGAYCNYDNDFKNGEVYGRLYNWHSVVDNRNLCPAGWHIPSYEDWSEISYYKGLSLAKDTALWLKPCIYKNEMNYTGFSALPGGLRTYTYKKDTFMLIGKSACWWTLTPYATKFANSTSLEDYDYTYPLKMRTYPKESGLSVRCIKD